jgi:polyribonucleotide nucleotidyltransferase
MPLSVDHVNPYDILAMNGASAALMISPVPLPTPIGAVRIGKIDGNFVVNPNEEDLVGNTDLDLIVAGTDDAILMVEAGANEIPEAEILDALDIAHSEIRKICAVQRELAEKAGKEKLVIEPPQIDEDLVRQISGSHGAALDAATQVEDKLERQAATKAVEEAVLEQYSGDPEAATFDDYRQKASSPSIGSRSRSSASASPSTSAVPTAAASGRSARSRSRSAPRRARTARRSSPAARRRP